MKQEICLQVWRAQGLPGYIFIGSKRGEKWAEIPLEFKPGNKQNENKIRKLLLSYQDMPGNLYWCPNIFTGTRRLRDKTPQGIFLYADLDPIDPRTIDEHLRPTIAWESSSSRYQALWRLDKPLKAPQLEEMNRRLTYTLNADKSGWDLTQYLRIPGTLNYKYIPPQPGKLLWDDGPVYSPKNLLPYIQEGGEANLISESQRMASFISILKRYKNQIPSKLYQLIQYPPQEVNKKVGKRSDILWMLENELISLKIPLEDIVEIIRLSAWNKYRGRRDEQERIFSEISKIHESHLKGNRPNKPQAGDISIALLDHAPVVRTLDEYLPQEIRWLWFPYIPRGGTTILDGDPGIGKTYLALALVAHLSSGLPLPGEVEIIPPPVKRASKKGAGNPGLVNIPEDKAKSNSEALGALRGPPGRVLYMTAEDDPGLTLRPRLERMQVTLSNVLICEGIHPSGDELVEPLNFSTPQGVEVLSALCEKYQPEMVILDPLIAFLGGADINKANEVRPIMVRLNTLARKHDIALLMIRHLTKGARERIIYRGMGTIDLIAAARSALLVAPDPDNPEIRVMFHQKHNLSAQGPSLGYTITDEGFKWIGEVSISAVDALRPEGTGSKNPKKRDEAAEWLEDFLSQFPQGVASKALLEKAKEKGFSEKTVRRARADLKIVIKRQGPLWVWKLKSGE